NLLSAVLLDQGRVGEAAEAVSRSLDIRSEAYREAPEIFSICHGLALTYSQNGRVLARQGRRVEAAEAYQQAVVYQQRQVEVGPTASRRQELAVMLANLAWLHVAWPPPDRDASQALLPIRRA